jgi:hypothetical protein
MSNSSFQQEYYKWNQKLSNKNKENDEYTLECINKYSTIDYPVTKEMLEQIDLFFFYNEKNHPFFNALDCALHVKKVLDVNFDYPIIIHRYKDRSLNKMVDTINNGAHRYIAAYINGMTTIKAIVIEEENDITNSDQATV